MNASLLIQTAASSSPTPSPTAPKLGLLSNNVVLPSQSCTVRAGLLLDDGQISQVLLSPPELSTLQQLYPEYLWEDLTSYYISPGLIDLNVSFNSDLFSPDEEAFEYEKSVYSPNTGSLTSTTPERWEDYEVGTRAAIAGGVTVVIEAPTLKPHLMVSADDLHSKRALLEDCNLYCDIGLLASVSPSNLAEIPRLAAAGAVGFKAYLVPSGKDMEYFDGESAGALFSAAQQTGKTVFFHPELINERFLYVCSPFRTEDLEERHWLPEPANVTFVGAFPNELVAYSSEDSSSCNSSPKGSLLISPSEEKALQKIYRDQQNNHESLVKVEIQSYSNSGDTLYVLEEPHTPVKAPTLKGRPPPISVSKPPVLSENTDYKLVLANSSVHWEINALQLLVAILAQYPEAKLHFCNLSSASAVIALDKLKRAHPALGVTCETASFYLHFSEENIKQGDTRFKVSPPIRERPNQLKLAEVLRMGLVDTVNSYHRPIKPSLKCLRTGNFKRAVAGICSLGFTLQAAWEALGGHPQVAAVRLGQLLSEAPAKIAGLQFRGQIAEGFSADLVVWAPSVQESCQNLYNSYPFMSPYMNETLHGKIYKTFLRGNVGYCEHTFTPYGKVVI